MYLLRGFSQNETDSHIISYQDLRILQFDQEQLFQRL